MLRIAALVFSCVMLAACQTTAPSDVVYPAASAAPAPATPAAAQAASAAEPPAAAQAEAAPPPKPATPARTRNQPAGRAARAPDTPAETNTDDGPFTVTKAREQCWMLSESDKAVRGDLDKKVKWVEQCVDKKMNASIGR